MKQLINTLAKGNILDIGCGPQEMPSYLSELSKDKLFGMDPLLPQQPHPFVFQQAICEYIPWEADSFDTVIVGASFDHVLYLDQSIQEINRVMRRGVVLIIWISFEEDTKPYDPEDENFAPADVFHMFHFAETGLRPYSAPIFRSPLSIKRSQ